MKALVIGGFEPASALVSSLRAEGLEAKVAEAAGEGRSEIAALARELVELETLLAEEKPDAVVLADADDQALAGLLVATKLLIPVIAVHEPWGTNRELVAQLADEVAPAGDGELAAWLAARPKLLRP
jgi:hypothetical protein